MSLYKEMLSPHHPAGVPDPVRLRFRGELNEVITQVLYAQQTAEAGRPH